jgi:hypothetical protein
MDPRAVSLSTAYAHPQYMSVIPIVTLLIRVNFGALKPSLYVAVKPTFALLGGFQLAISEL